MKGWITLTSLASDNTKEKIYVQVRNISAITKYYGKDRAIISFVGDNYCYVEVLESPDAVMNLINNSYYE